MMTMQMHQYVRRPEQNGPKMSLRIFNAQAVGTSRQDDLEDIRNTWVHVAFTLDGSILKVYMNG
jgi:hypothetical protein